eukprot:TRINITY_DN24174_c0_g1_i1.p1 TRINITY_DN24174_c0_g1~~TRINITY_DN24174_c0_g1_i1.p1  ORF type:complete len:353 (+),score=99.05 TRINITY_DN24174_c0_g1_i1:48-1106(+)
MSMLLIPRFPPAPRLRHARLSHSHVGKVNVSVGPSARVRRFDGKLATDILKPKSKAAALGVYNLRRMPNHPVPSPERHETAEAPRRDDFWRWGTLSIRRLPMLMELLDRMLPRRYHKWCTDSSYEHYWGDPARSADGQTQELFLLGRFRQHDQVPSVLKFRMKETPQSVNGIRITIDYLRVITNPMHRWTMWTARDAMCRLITEMDDWYAQELKKEVLALGETAAEEKRAMLEDGLTVKRRPPSAETLDALSKIPKAAAALMSLGTLPPASTPTHNHLSVPQKEDAKEYLYDQGKLWGETTVREQRPVHPRALYDPREFDLQPLQRPEWPIPRVEGNIGFLRDKLRDPNIHR